MTPKRNKNSDSAWVRNACIGQLTRAHNYVQSIIKSNGAFTPSESARLERIRVDLAALLADVRKK